MSPTVSIPAKSPLKRLVRLASLNQAGQGGCTELIGSHLPRVRIFGPCVLVHGLHSDHRATTLSLGLGSHKLSPGSAQFFQLEPPPFLPQGPPPCNGAGVPSVTIFRLRVCTTTLRRGRPTMEKQRRFPEKSYLEPEVLLFIAVTA